MPEVPSSSGITNSGLPNASGSEVKPQAKTADQINDLFKELDNEPEKEIKVVDKSSENKSAEVEGDDENLEEKELEEIKLVGKEEEEEEDPEKLIKEEELNIDDPPRKKEILAKYPDLFKTFPFLEKVIYRDKQYTELFGSFDDAKELAGKAEVFNMFENQLLSGETTEILKNVRETDNKAFDVIVDNYMIALHKVDKDAYFHVIGNLNKKLIMEMVKEANNTDNDDLRQAALLVNQFVFGSSTFTAPQARSSPKSAEHSEAERERLGFIKERFESSRDDLQSRVDNTLKATISQYIDPKSAMSTYAKKNAVNDALKYLNESISKDPTVAKNLDKLWRVAFDTKFSKDSLDRIKAFYLSKAKGNLKGAILKAREEALKDVKTPEKEKDDDSPVRGTRRENISPGRPSQPNKNNGMKKGETVTDFFMRD